MKGLIPDFALDFWGQLPPLVQYLVGTTSAILVGTVGVILTGAFATYFER